MPKRPRVLAANQHIELYGEVRKVLLSRYFALGRYHRNDFFQESTELEGRPDGDWSKPEVRNWRDQMLNLPAAERQLALWKKKPADRDNPWLFGSKLAIALASEAQLGLSVAEQPLGRMIRSGKQLFKFNLTGVSGFPLRYDPVTCDGWFEVPNEPGRRVSTDFLVSPNGAEYLFSTPPNDPRHFPYIPKDVGISLMGENQYEEYLNRRNRYLEHYRKWEPSQDELVGVITTYIAAAEGSRAPSTKNIASVQLALIAEYLAQHAYLMVRPGGGLSARGAGDALPALEWPFTQAIKRVRGGDLGLKTASVQEALQRAGVWDLCKENTEREIALAWLHGIFNPALLGAIESILALWGVSSWEPKFVNPGQMGFAVGILQSSAAFDCWNKDGDKESQGLAIAALLHSWPPETRLNIYIELTSKSGGPRAPFSAGFVPFLGFMAIGGTDNTIKNGYHFWLRTRRQRGIDTDPVEHYSATLFASAVELMLSQGQNVAEETHFLKLLKERHAMLARGDEPPIVIQHDVFAAVDYLAAVALAWRYRRERESAGAQVPSEWPKIPPPDHKWPEPAVPRSVVEEMSAYLSVEAIQGHVPPEYHWPNEAWLFTESSPKRPPAPKPSLRFVSRNDVDIEDRTFTVGPGSEVFTGIALQWGDEWEITAVGTVRVDGRNYGPEGGEGTINDTRYPIHSGRDPNGTPNCLVARLNNYVFIGRRRKERWLYPEAALLYLRLNQAHPSGKGTLTVRVRLRGSLRPLPSVLEVDCIISDSRDRDRRIDGIGGKHRDGSRWRLTTDQAIERLKEGTVFFSRPTGKPAVKIISKRRNGRTYLATLADDGTENNLSSKGFQRCSDEGSGD